MQVKFSKLSKEKDELQSKYNSELEVFFLIYYFIFII